MKVFCISLGIFVTLGSTAFADKEFLWAVTGAQGVPSDLYVIDPADASIVTKVGRTGETALTGLEVKDGVLFAVQGQKNIATDPKHLFRVNPSTAALTTVATFDPKYPISDLARRPSDGTIFGFAVLPGVKKLITVNTVTGAITEIGAANNIANVSLTFGLDGTLYLVRANGLYTMNPATGAALTGPFALSGATTNISNFMATNAAGTIYCGLRTATDTNLYILNPTTRVTTLVGVIPGVSQVSGIAFDSAAPPVFKVNGKKKITTKKAAVKLKGVAKSRAPLTVSTKGAEARAKNGKWTLKVKLKPGKNRIKLLCDDGLGQKKTAKVTVIRE